MVLSSRAPRRNWAGNHAYRAHRVHEPESIEQLQEIVASSARLRALGSRHSFNDLADTTGDHLSLVRLPRVVEIDGTARTVVVDGGIRYGDVCPAVEAAGFALHNLASLPHISVAGACITATHGSGERSGSLSTAVSAIEVVRADGEIEVFRPTGDARDFAGAVVSLGALGIVTRLSLDLEPTFRMRQDVYEDLPLERLVRHFDEIAGSAESVSLFTAWRGPSINQVWLKRRVHAGEGLDVPSELFGATAAVRQRHPIAGMPPEACTEQLGVPGPWYERLPHFRLDHTPSAGDELQSEYFVAREDAVAALLAVDRLRDDIAPLVQVSEIRTVAADELWLSPAYRRPSVAIHFTWLPDWPRVRRILPAVEAALAPFAPRPHWAKLFTLAPADVRSRYERRADFVDLAGRFDPGRKFRNDFLDRFVFGTD